MAIVIPKLLAEHCKKTAERTAWLRALPNTIGYLEKHWKISLGEPFQHSYVSCSWVAPAVVANGTHAVLKVGMPHMEAEQEMEGLLFWNGEAAVRLLKSEGACNAMLLERCEPGVPLFSISEPEQDVVLARMLRRLWRKPAAGGFRPLEALIAYWRGETQQDASRWPDPVLVKEGLQTFAILLAEENEGVLLATDLHAGNILSAQREPWLMIDPKPFVGDAAYDLTQHLLNCEQRLQAEPNELIRRLADLAEVDASRARMWLFARAAAEPRDTWETSWKIQLARRLAM